jgi:hypothetical protein
MTRLSERRWSIPPRRSSVRRSGRYTEVGAHCTVAHSSMGDYSYCVENTQIAYAKIGKFANIASHVRIYASMHPMERASLHHFSYRSAWYFEGESDDKDFFDWRAGQGSPSAMTPGSGTGLSSCRASPSAMAPASAPMQW